jgi:ketosteroid isomerase-like protein
LPILTATVALLTAGAVRAAGPSLPPGGAERTAAAVRAVEARFEVALNSEGVARAFRDFMDPVDGRTFGAEDPFRGREAIFRHFGGDGPAHVRLHLTTSDAWGAASGDLGATQGRFTLDGAGPVGRLRGFYVTVWRRKPGETWKGVVHIAEVTNPHGQAGR